MHGRSIVMAAALVLFGSLPVVSGQSLLQDDFTSDTALNTSLWTNQSPVLDALLTNYTSAWMAPKLSFGPGGMQMSGVDAMEEFTGLASAQTFTPPLTLTVTVEGAVANGNPFEVLLVNKDLSSMMSLIGNLNPANDPFYGIWMNYTHSGIMLHERGEVLFAQPAIKTVYTIQFSVDATGKGTVLLADANGELLSLRTGLAVGTAPFHVVLAQREGLPQTVGKNIAIWHRASVARGAIPPVKAAPATPEIHRDSR